MAAFTTIAAATVAVGGSAAKGFLAGDAAKVAAREAGRLEIKQEQLQQESVARLEQNFYDAIRATTDIYDKQLQLANVQGSQLLEAAQEGDQRGVAATAGKVKQVQDVGTGAIADKMAMQKLNIDMKRAQADETDAARIAALMDDRAAAAGLEAKAKRSEADQLSAASTGAFIDAGVSALSAGIGAFGGAEGRAVDSLVGSGEAASKTDALKMLGDGVLSNKDLNTIAKSGTMSGLASAAGSNVSPLPVGVTPAQPSFNFQLPGQGPQIVGAGLGDSLKNLGKQATNLVNFQNTGSVGGDQQLADPNNLANLFGTLNNPLDLGELFKNFKFGGTQ
jgi:hypothetical protein